MSAAADATRRGAMDCSDQGFALNSRGSSKDSRGNEGPPDTEAKVGKALAIGAPVAASRAEKFWTVAPTTAAEDVVFAISAHHAEPSVGASL
jgi:hypothetical protein